MTLTNSAAMPKLDWEIGDIQTNQKGVKSAPLTSKGAPIFEKLTATSSPLTTPFVASAFNDDNATRKNVCFRCTPELADHLTKIDSYMRQ